MDGAMRSIFASLLASTLALAALAACDATPLGDLASESAAVQIPGNSIPVYTFGFNAAWDDVGLGAHNGGVPAVTTWGENHLAVFQREGEALVHKVWNGSWQPAGGSWTVAHGVASDPSAVAWVGHNILDIVWRDPQNHVQHLEWTGSGWVQTDLDGRVEGRPSLALQADGYRADVFARAGGTVWHRAWVMSRGIWAPWENLGLPAAGDPVAVSTGRGKIELFLRGADGQTNQWSWDGSNDSTRYYAPLAGHFVARPSLGGYARSAPAVALRGSTLVAFVQGGDDGLYYRETSDSGWGPWITMNACTRGTPAIASWSNDRLDLLVQSKDNDRILHVAEVFAPSQTPGLSATCCGRDGQASCSYWACDSGFRLGSDGRTCRAIPCGVAGAPVCTTGRKCQPGLTANLSGTCTSCGSLNGFCCAEDADACVQGLCGHNDTFDINTCNHCGGSGELACPSNQAACLSADQAANPASGRCEDCGGFGQIACTNGRACDDDNAQPNAAGRCEHCGDTHELACGGSRCNEVHRAPDANGRCEFDHWCGGEHKHCCNIPWTGIGGDCDAGLECNTHLDEPNTCEPHGSPGGGSTPSLCSPGQQLTTYCATYTCTPGYPNRDEAYVCSQQAALQIIADRHHGCSIDPIACH
jgi:hypothetical protein